MAEVTVTDTGDGFVRSGMARFHADLAPMMRPIDSIAPAPYNYNNGDVDVIATSIQMNGMYRPIFVQRATGHIIAGNHTWMACKLLNAKAVPVVYLDVDDTVAKRIMIEDNEAARKAMPDRGLLLSLLDEIHEDTGAYLASINDEDYEVIKALNEIPMDSADFAQWPTFSVQVPPHVLRAFMHMTREADDDRDRFELILRLAGWDGSAF